MADCTQAIVTIQKVCINQKGRVLFLVLDLAANQVTQPSGSLNSLLQVKQQLKDLMVFVMGGVLTVNRPFLVALNSVRIYTLSWVIRICQKLPCKAGQWEWQALVPSKRARQDFGIGDQQLSHHERRQRGLIDGTSLKERELPQVPPSPPDSDPSA